MSATNSGVQLLNNSLSALPYRTPYVCIDFASQVAFELIFSDLYIYIPLSRVMTEKVLLEKG